MKTFALSIILSLSLGVLFAQEPTATVRPKVMEVNGDTVNTKVSLRIPGDKAFRKDGTYTMVAKIGEHEVATMSKESSKMGDIAKRGINQTFKFSFPYFETYNGETLNIEHYYEAGGKRTDIQPIKDIATCCNTTGQLVLSNAVFELDRFTYEPPLEVPRKAVAHFDFPAEVPRAGAARYNNSIRSLNTYLRQFPNAEITVRAYTAAEGDVEKNRQAALQRAEAAKSWVIARLKEGGARSLKDSQVKTAVSLEEWDNVSRQLKTGFSPAQTTNALDVIKNDAYSPTAETALATLLGSRQPAEKALTPLRRITVIAHDEKAIRPGYTVMELDTIIEQAVTGAFPTSSLPDMLSKDEHKGAVTLSRTQKAKFATLSSYFRRYPEDTTFYPSLAVLSFTDNLKADFGRYDGYVTLFSDRSEPKPVSGRSLQVAPGENMPSDDPAQVYNNNIILTEQFLKHTLQLMPENLAVLNNLGALNIAKGDFHEARVHLQKVLDKDAAHRAANYNMGVALAKLGDYVRAMSHFDKANDVPGVDYNRALINLMQGDVEKATANLQKELSRSPDHPKANYLMAVTAARKQQPEVLEEHLQKAIKDEQFKKRALTDLEFQKFREKDQLDSLLKE